MAASSHRIIDSKDLLDRILALLLNEVPDMYGLGTTNFTAKQGVAEIIDDSYSMWQDYIELS